MKARKIRNGAARRPALSSIGSAVAMVLIATGAHAAETAVSGAFAPSVTGTSTSVNPQTNLGAVDASISSATVGVTTTGTAGTPPTSSYTNGNAISAKATGNIEVRTIAPTPGSPPTPVSSAATLALSQNSGVISSSVTNSSMGNYSTTIQAGSVAAADNTISATTTLNSGSSLVLGTAAASGTALAGSSVLRYPVGAPQVFDAKGNIVVTTFQSATGASSSAESQGNRVDLWLLPSSGAIAAGASLERNSIAAVLKGNSATNTAAIVSGGAPSFAGSAVVSNLQVNNNATPGAVTHSATNNGSAVDAVVSGVALGGSNTLQSALAVRGNHISSAATGNEALSGTAGTAGNFILVDGVSVAGIGTPATALNNSTHNGVGVNTNVNADLAIVNSQGNIGVGITSSTTNALVGATVQSIASGGSVDLRANAVTAAATGNAASSAISSADGLSAFKGTSALSNQQANYQSPITAQVTASNIGVLTGFGGTTNNAVVSVAGNSSAATATGNQISQSLAIDAGGMTLGSASAVLTGGTANDGRVSAGGAATITNLQGNYGSPVAATNDGSQVFVGANLVASPIAGSTFAVTGNTQQAAALGSGATNALTLATGSTLGTGAGIASVQMGDAGATVSATLSNAAALLAVNGNVTGSASSIALTDNKQIASATGNSAKNTLGIDAVNIAAVTAGGAASTVTVGAGGLPFDGNAGSLPTVNAAFGILGDQSVQASVKAVASGPSAPGLNAFAVTVAGNLGDTTAGGKLANDRNTLGAEAYGNTAANGLTLDLNNLSSSTSFIPGLLSGTNVANVTNVQSVAGNATQISADASGVTPVRTVISGSVTNATVSSSGNTTQALAYGNSATGNTVKVTGNNITTLVATLPVAPSGAGVAVGAASVNAAFGVQNAQSGQGSVSATRSGGPEVQTYIVGNLVSSSVAADKNKTIVEANSNSATNGVSIEGNALATTSAVQNLQQTSADVTAQIGSAAATRANQSGVQVKIDGLTVQGQAVSVSGNIASGSATGNSASNSLAVDGNTIAVRGALPAIATSVGALINGAYADHAVSNVQTVSGAGAISSSVSGAYGIDTTAGASISGTQLSVSNNAQGSQAVANTATNGVELTGNSITARTALQSTQTSTAKNVDSTSSMEVFSPAASTSSRIDLSGNKNVSLAVINDVSNTLSVASTNTSPASAAGSTAVMTAIAATGDHVLLNQQTAAAAVTSKATTNLYNDDSGTPAPVTAGLAGGSLSIARNSTVAEVSANRAANSVSLVSDAVQGATSGIVNTQASSAAVTAQASTTANVAVTAPSPLNGGSVALNANTTSALARGNAATNLLESSAGSGYGGLAAQGTGGGGLLPAALNASAAAAIRNSQTNDGAVSASSSGASYMVALNSTGGPVGTTLGTVGVTGNTLTAEAYGNSATNRITQTALNNGTPSAVIVSTQVNTGAVTATVSGASVGIGVAGGGGNSTLRTTGNQITASATGNSSVSSIATR